MQKHLQQSSYELWQQGFAAYVVLDRLQELSDVISMQRPTTQAQSFAVPIFGREHYYRARS
jgi:hypothetical protein